MKNRSDSLKLAGIEAAIRRLPQGHTRREYLMQQQKQINAGIIGEEVLNKLFNRVKFNFDYFIFHDLHLKSSATFQIDTLFLSPYYAIILEMKNISGHIKIRQNHPQMERTLVTGQTDYFKNPVGQIMEITDVFEDFLNMNGVSLPLYRAIVFKDANRSLQFDEVTIPIFGPQELPHFIRTLPRELCKLSPLELSDLVDVLLSNHREYIPLPIVQHFFIESKDIMPGVLCNICQALTVEKRFREWRCRSCGMVTKTAHYEALRDYALVLSNKINNREFRRFLKIQNPREASDIIRRMKLNKTGSKKTREYLLEYQNMRPQK
ncbi:NERD domain-containing protein [Paenisporosarcina sp. NPDC076898]